MKAQIKKNQIVISLPVEKTPVPSSTGKTLIVAKSGTDSKAIVTYKDKEVTVNVSAYIYPEAKKPYEKTGEPAAKLEKNMMVITLPIGKPEPSSSGKTLLLSSTHGAIRTDVKVGGQNVFLNVNVYIPAN